MNGDLVSIICVTRNAGGCLERCLRSVFDQVYPRIQMIVQDGGSTDGTVEILSKWSDRIAYWNSEPDEGIYDAMNKALSHVTGDWVYFIGADDYLYPSFSAFVADELKDRGTIYYSNVMYKGRVAKGGTSNYERLKKGIYHQSIVYPAEVFKEYRYDTRYKVSADHHLTILLHSDRRFRFKYCDYTFVMFNHSGISSELGTDSNLIDELPRLARKHFGHWVYLRYMLRLAKDKAVSMLKAAAGR